jgi:hypothetical protein
MDYNYFLSGLDKPIFSEEQLGQMASQKTKFEEAKKGGYTGSYEAFREMEILSEKQRDEKRSKNLNTILIVGGVVMVLVTTIFLIKGKKK